MFERHILKHWGGKASRPPYTWRKEVYFPQAGRLAKFRRPSTKTNLHNPHHKTPSLVPAFNEYCELYNWPSGSRWSRHCRASGRCDSEHDLTRRPTSDWCPANGPSLCSDPCMYRQQNMYTYVREQIEEQTWTDRSWLRHTVVERRCLAGDLFPVPRSTCSWWVTTTVGKPSATGQPTRLTQFFILSGSING